MKTVVFHGSPRKNGNSDTLVEYFLKGLKESANNEIKEFHTNELNVKLNDDMQEVYPAFGEADVVVFATPILWGYMTAQLKTVLDRMEAIASDKYFGGKTFVVIITYWHHYETLAAFFKRAIADFYRDVTLHTILYCSQDKNSREEVHVSNCKEKLEEAYELGRSIAKR